MPRLDAVAAEAREKARTQDGNQEWRRAPTQQCCTPQEEDGSAPAGMKLTAVVAASENGVIGRDNALPWHMPADLAYFKRVTMGKPILMGRRTWESIGRPLPGRRNIVMTRGDFRASGADTVHSLDEALALVAGEQELMIIGGAEIFRIAMPRMTHMHLTRVHCNVDGDVLLPEIDPGEWREVSREEHPADARNACALSFTLLERTGAAVSP